MLAVMLTMTSACATRGLRFPGPLGSLGHNAPSLGWDLPADDAVVSATSSGRRASTPAGEQVARAALRFLGASGVWIDGQGFRTDCSGLVAAAYSRVDLEMRGGSADLYEKGKELGIAHTRKVPSVGDVAFWENTYDRNGNRKVDDGITHSGVVVGVDSDGTIEIVHRGSSGVAILHMNLLHPGEEVGPQDKRWNDRVRVPGSRDPSGTRYLAGELFVGFASYWREIDDHS